MAAFHMVKRIVSSPKDLRHDDFRSFSGFLKDLIDLIENLGSLEGSKGSQNVHAQNLRFLKGSDGYL